MPPKGYKKLGGGRKRPPLNLTLSEECQELLEAIAVNERLFNLRSGQPNKSRAVEIAVLAYKLFIRTYPGSLPYPQRLLNTLYKIQSNDGDATEFLEDIQEHIDYIHSWSEEVDLSETLISSKKVKDGWIV